MATYEPRQGRHRMKMYVNTNGLLAEDDAKMMAMQIPDHAVRAYVLSLLDDDMARVKQIIAELCREILENEAE